MIELEQIFLPFVKIMVIVLQGIYFLFAFMLTRQIKIMNKNFKTDTAALFSLLGAINLLLSIVVLALTILAY